MLRVPHSSPRRKRSRDGDAAAAAPSPAAAATPAGLAPTPGAESGLQRARRLGHSVECLHPIPPRVQPLRLELADLTRWDGPPWVVDTDDEDGGREHLPSWIDRAAESNHLAALRSAITQLAAARSRFDAEQWLRAVLRYRDGLDRIRVAGAQYLAAESNFPAVVPSATTLIMRAINTGDMYQVRASLTIHPDYQLLIWGVAPESRRQAEMAAGLMDDPNRVYYTEAPSPPPGYSKSETWTTKDIGDHLTEDLLKGTNLQSLSVDRVRELWRIVGPSMIDRLRLLDMTGRERVDWLKQELGRLKSTGDDRYFLAMEQLREQRMQTLAEGFAPYDDEEGEAFGRDLEAHHFEAGQRYVIVNFRATGHSGRPGANAPALDTGTVGVQQLVAAVRDQLHGVSVVPMGEAPEEMADGPNLLSYWTWESTRGSRRRQTSLLRYLSQNYDVVGAIGMRSGVMDQIAILGIPIISIDISPHRGLRHGEKPDLATSKGWSRGIKLEDAYRERYGHVFLHDARTDELTRPLEGWEGRFSEFDLGTLADSISFYFDGIADPRTYRHRSHPLDPERVQEAFDQLLDQLIGRTDEPINAYDLIEHFHPYVAEIYSLTRRVPELGDKAADLLHAVQKLIGDVQGAAPAPSRKIKWMRDHQYQALLQGLVDDRWYDEQRQYVATAFAQPADQAALTYRGLDAYYRRPVNVHGLVLDYLARWLQRIERKIVALAIQLERL